MRRRRRVGSCEAPNAAAWRSAARQREHRRGRRVVSVARIAEEQLVAAVAGQRDRHALARDLRHEIRRHRRRIGERLVEHVREPIDDGEHLPVVARLLVVLGAEMAGDRRGVVRFVELRVLEADRERPHRRRTLLLHQRDDERRVDAARQEGAERHVGDHPLANRRGQTRFELRSLRLASSSV